MNQSIDIVVTYLDDSDKSWREEFNKYKKEEVEKGITVATNEQAFGEERLRNWENMQYWFRGIETNCPWVNKIFFITQKESQIPAWLNVDNPKLRIVYHEEYIPKELLPTFNTMTIQTFIPLIKDLSEFYIYLDDDHFILNPIKSTMFFNKNKPVHKSTQFWGGSASYSSKMGAWGKNLDNTFNLEKKYGQPTYKYAPYHLPNPQVKSINQKILKDNWDTIYNGLKVSKFRHDTNICPTELYTNITKRLKKCIINNQMFKNSNYIGLDMNTVFDNYKTKDIVCFNDTEKVKTYEEFQIIKERFLEFLQKKFPNKSQFERGENIMFDMTLIIPCHNLEKWITPCLESICNQENKQKIKRKVIFICDNCTDKTKSIIKTQMKKCYTWVTEIIDAHVGSPGEARNLGLDKADTKYIWFVDGDDWITCNNAVDELYRLMKKDDMDIIEFKIKSNAHPEGAFGGGTVWRCVLSSRIIGDMRFNNRQTGEDNDFIWDIYHKKGAKYGKIAMAPYFYNFPREGSQMWKQNLTKQKEEQNKNK